ncbi:hypothetical protein SERLA73DRAFT_152136 [Serpula lacrymans var. lacrymans S7.3]|uniref:CCHC-type domain-containing protein n=1 Tax=Serpula lacrymans var. lacrymans (strain S7.3) TaxID=936435 RepID=F8PU46_SERL3|nr:hypothetical protein SERLA73DRAFT_152136 [Serpula lacrymans var. lacrymans S7.3]
MTTEAFGEWRGPREEPDTPEIGMGELSGALPPLEPQAPTSREAGLEQYVRARIEQEQRRLHDLYKTQLKEAKEEVEELLAKLRLATSNSSTSAPAASAPTPPNTQPKRVDRTRTALQKPENFDGDRKEYKAFREALMLNYEDDEEYFADDKRERSPITEWMETKIEKRMRGENLKSTYESFEWFAHKMETRFKNVHEQLAARNDIMILRQGKNTAEKHFEHFEELRTEANYLQAANEDFLISLLRRNMNEPLVNQVIYGGREPANYEEWKKELIRIDYLWRHREAEKESFRSTEKKKQDGGGKTEPKVERKKDGSGYLYTQAGDPMKVDKAEYRQKGLCYWCGEKGHRSFECKKEAHAKPQFNVREFLQNMSAEERAKILQAKDAADLRSKEKETKKDVNLNRERVRKIPDKKITAHSKEESAVTKKEFVKEVTQSGSTSLETTEPQKAVTQLGSTDVTDGSTSSKERHGHHFGLLKDYETKRKTDPLVFSTSGRTKREAEKSQ